MFSILFRDFILFRVFLFHVCFICSYNLPKYIYSSLFTCVTFHLRSYYIFLVTHHDVCDMVLWHIYRVLPTTAILSIIRLSFQLKFSFLLCMANIMDISLYIAFLNGHFQFTDIFPVREYGSVLWYISFGMPSCTLYMLSPFRLI